MDITCHTCTLLLNIMTFRSFCRSFCLMPSMKDALLPSQVVWLEAGMLTVPIVACRVGSILYVKGSILYSSGQTDPGQSKLRGPLVSPFCQTARNNFTCPLAPLEKHYITLCVQKYLSYNHDLLQLKPGVKSPSL